MRKCAPMQLHTVFCDLKNQKPPSIKPQHLDVYLWLLTGFGELGCYEVLPFVMDHKRAELWTGQSNYSVVLVNSLLVSLMIDQVSSLREWGVTAALLSDHPGVAVKLQVTVPDVCGIKFSLLYAAPEAIISEQCFRILLSLSRLYDW